MRLGIGVAMLLLVVACTPTSPVSDLSSNLTVAQGRIVELEQSLLTTREQVTASATACNANAAVRAKELAAAKDEVFTLKQELAFAQRRADQAEAQAKQCAADLAKYKPAVVATSGFRSVPYDDLMRNSEEYLHASVLFRGEVAQVLENDDGTFALRIAVTKLDYGLYTDVVFVDYSGPRVLEKDLVTLRGYFTGLMTYTAVLGNEITVPRINADSIVVDTKAGDRN